MESTIQHASMAKVNSNSTWKSSNLVKIYSPSIMQYIFLKFLESSGDFHSQFSCHWCFFVADTPLSQVKVGEIGEWIGRRNKSPSAITGAVSRAFWRWQHKYWQPRRAGIAPYYQAIVGSMIFFYAINYGKISKFENSWKFSPQQPDDFLLPFTEHHRNYKYH